VVAVKSLLSSPKSFPELRPLEGNLGISAKYKTNTGTVLLAHTKAQLSKEAIAAYEERKRNDTFRYSSNEALERKLMCGNNDKEQQKVEKQRGHSAGIGAGITCCGIEVDVYELFGKESCSQVTQSQNDSISAPVN